MKYLVEVTRTRVDVGYVTIEAEDQEEALRKYYAPDYSKGEELIFDSEIDWETKEENYDERVIYPLIDRDQAIIRFFNNKSVLLVDDDFRADRYADRIEDILCHTGWYAYEEEE